MLLGLWYREAKALCSSLVLSREQMFGEEWWQPPISRPCGWFGSAGLVESLLQLLEVYRATTPLTGTVSQQQNRSVTAHQESQSGALCCGFMEVQPLGMAL